MGEHATYGNLARSAARLLLTSFGVIYRIQRSVGCARRDGGRVQKISHAWALRARWWRDWPRPVGVGLGACDDGALLRRRDRATGR